MTAKAPGKTVLIVEDGPEFRLILSRILTTAGYRVLAAPDGEQGLRLLREGRPDLALLDVNLPDTTGYELCGRIREEGARLPIIFITVRSAPENVVTGLKAGGDDYIFKPFAAEEVVARVAALFRRLG